MQWLDSHYHFDFIKDSNARYLFLQELVKEEITIVAQTVTPSGFSLLKQSLDKLNLKPGQTPYLSLGFHPWWIESKSQADKELAIFRKELTKSQLIGEVGLDFSVKGLEKAQENLQVYVFSEILKALTDHTEQRFILSIHAVRSASKVLDLLEEVGAPSDKILPILHRFNGTSDELTRHRDMGGYLSVHPSMLKSKKGRAYLQQMSGDHLLLESDLPDGPQDEWEAEEVEQRVKDLKEMLNQTVDKLSSIRQENMAELILKTQNRLYY
ncbi:TatD family hydrolase [Facklamia miroungae]|uniref:TatD DNase family protein n=1 Tax=Facklamia miroungae TaxID=120956 RepID=A0A1G7QFW1_9LACT|nr:TatD family hydrolase [Facklamia miroungae]NKZ28926.1 TatD family hydrolase [Facklamia miroungae]SDF97394.1 TatD DNase family protein [Facklamia miroungae]